MPVENGLEHWVVTVKIIQNLLCVLRNFLIPCSMYAILKRKIRIVNFDSAMVVVKENTHLLLKLFRRRYRVFVAIVERNYILFYSYLGTIILFSPLYFLGLSRLFFFFVFFPSKILVIFNSFLFFSSTHLFS